MRDKYFDEREVSVAAASGVNIPSTVVAVLNDLISQRLDDGSLGFGFPEFCADGHWCCGADWQAFNRHIAAMLPGMSFPLDSSNPPSTIDLCTFLEIVAEKLGKPVQSGYHSFFKHYHLTFDRSAGLAEWRADVNVLFRRNRVPLAVADDGTIRRILAAELEELIISFPKETGDDYLDRLLASSRRKIAAPDATIRQEALEELWDAFERFKTLLNVDKRQGVMALLDLAADGSVMRAALDDEAKALTTLGNSLRIRHHEVEQEPVGSDREVDYLFHRLLALILLLARGRAERS